MNIMLICQQKVTIETQQLMLRYKKLFLILQDYYSVMVTKDDQPQEDAISVNKSHLLDHVS